MIQHRLALLPSLLRLKLKMLLASTTTTTSTNATNTPTKNKTKSHTTNISTSIKNLVLKILSYTTANTCHLSFLQICDSTPETSQIAYELETE